MTDVHTQTAKSLFGSVTEGTRRFAKSLNYMSLYGGVSMQEDDDILDGATVESEDIYDIADEEDDYEDADDDSDEDETEDDDFDDDEGGEGAEECDGDCANCPDQLNCDGAEDDDFDDEEIED